MDIWCAHIYIYYSLLLVPSNNNSDINDKVMRKIFLISSIDFERFYYILSFSECGR